MGNLSFPHYVATITVASFTCLLSVCGSLAIIIMVSRDLKKVHNRTVLSMSISDAMVSASIMLQPFTLPRERVLDMGRPWAVGNDASCSTVGFVYTTFTGLTTMYTAFLSMNFVLQLRYKWTEEMVTKWVERYYHAFALCLVFAFTVTPLFSQSYNLFQMLGICYIREYPHNCHEPGSEVECERGGEISNTLGRWGGVVLSMVALSGFASTIVLYRTIRTTLQRGRRHSFGDDKQTERIRTVTWQCIMYFLAYLNTFCCSVVILVTTIVFELDYRLDETGIFVVVLCIYIFFPLQGAMNFVIFISPRYRQWRQALPEESAFYVLRCAVSKEDVPTRAVSKKNSSGSNNGNNYHHHVTPPQQNDNHSRVKTEQTHGDSMVVAAQVSSSERCT